MPRPREGAKRPSTGAVLRTVASLILGLASAFAAQPAAAQAVSPFRITDFDGWAGLGFFTSLEDRSRASSARSKNDRVEFSQLLHMETQGYFYHPRFVTFNGGVEFQSVEGVLHGGDSRILGGGSFRLKFLEEHPTSFALFGSAFRNEVDRAFSTPYDLTTLLFGGNYSHGLGWLPFDITYQHRSRSSDEDNELDETSDEIMFNGTYVLGEQSDGRIQYDLTFEDRFGILTRRQNLIAENRSYFGEDQERRLFTNIIFNEQVDGLERYALIGNTDLHWQHTEDLATRYHLTVNWNDVDIQTVTAVNPRFYLRHDLYKSLSTQFELSGRFEDASYGRRMEFGTSLSERYIKRLGSWGRFVIGVQPRTRLTMDRPDEDTAFEIDERHLMLAGTPEPLFRNDVIASSIVVTSLDGSIVYDEGVLGDYIVIQTGDGFETSIELTPISDIADGDSVLVDYAYRLGGKRDVLFTNLSFTTSLRVLDQLLLYGRYNKSDQHLLSGDERKTRLNNIDRYEVGATLDGLFYSIDAEYENYDATLGAFWSYSGSVSLFTYGLDAWRGSLTGEYIFQNYSETNEKVNRLRLGGTTTVRLFRRGLLEVETSYLRERWSGEMRSTGNDLDSVYVDAAFSWTRGKLEVKLESRMVQILREAEDRRVYRVNLEARRRF